MNQYIITEKEIQMWENDLDSIDEEWGLGRGRGTDYHTIQQTKIINKIRSHPYQIERDKVLDEVLKKIDWRFNDTERGRRVIEVCKGIIEELKQASDR
jgi:hypothetical protein